MKMKKSRKGAGSRGRRTTLKTLLTGGGFVTMSALPGHWFKPVVDAVVLPVHAQTSPQVAANGFAINLVTEAPSLLDRIIPSAHAAVLSASGFLCIEERDGDGKDYKASFDFNGGVARTAGDYGKCTNLICGVNEFSLLVSGKNDDGSFDFELYFGTGCDGESFESNTTNTSCNLKPEDCKKKKKKKKVSS